MNEEVRIETEGLGNEAGGSDTSKKKKETGYALFDWAEALAIALTVIVVVFAFFVRTIGVDGTSMVPTLQNRDQLIISHIGYDEPESGDIVVIVKKSFMDNPIVKRVIATEGQTVDINFSTHEVTVDGEVLYEPYINEPTAMSGTMEFPATVPEGHVFVMGDNRNKSSDSRDIRLGMVDKRCIVGKVIFRILPINKIGTVYD